LRARDARLPWRRARLPVSNGRGGLVAGVDACSNPALRAVRGDDGPDQQSALWLEANGAALRSSNEFVERHGLPLAKYRQF